MRSLIQISWQSLTFSHNRSSDLLYYTTFKLLTCKILNLWIFFFVNVHLKLLSPGAFFSPKCTKYRLAADIQIHIFTLLFFPAKHEVSVLSHGQLFGLSQVKLWVRQDAVEDQESFGKYWKLVQSEMFFTVLLWVTRRGLLSPKNWFFESSCRTFYWSSTNCLVFIKSRLV